MLRRFGQGPVYAVNPKLERLSMRLHLHLRCSDLAASTHFYNALLGAPDKDIPDLVRYQPDGLPMSLTLMPGSPAPLQAPEHLGLKAESAADLAALWARLDESGLAPTRTETGTSCCASTQDKRWYVDPDGRPWEVYRVLDDSVPPDWAVPELRAAAPKEPQAGGCCAAPDLTPAVTTEQASGGCCG
jgi:catechol 2,3-dioxygenase-like lactoylglutathione lyase family enzyme